MTKNKSFLIRIPASTKGCQFLPSLIHASSHDQIIGFHARKGEKDADGKGLSWPGIAVDDVSSCQ